MKPSKPTNSGTDSSLRAPRKISCPAELREFQRVMAAALFRPLTRAASREELAVDMARFEWAQVAFYGPSKAPISPDNILDTPPSKLRLALQPYLSLLELGYAVDDFLMAVKKRQSNVLRGEASNAVDSGPTARARRKRIRPPKREKVYLVVHRHDNMLYYRRLDPEAFAILSALNRGVTVEDAASSL